MTATAPGEHPMDPRTYAVSPRLDGLRRDDQRRAEGQAAAVGVGNLVTPTGTGTSARTRTRGGQPVVPYERPDDRDELTRLRSLTEGQGELVARLAAQVAVLESGMSKVLRRIYPNGIPINEGETTP